MMVAWERFKKGVSRKSERGSYQPIQATSRPKYECIVCDDSTDFAETTHLIAHKICVSCIKEYLHVKIIDEGLVNITCPSVGCIVALEYEDIRKFAYKVDFARYDELLCKRFYETDPKFRWCTNRNCGAGQIVENGEAASYFSCVKCNFKTCFTCSTPLHTGLTCAQYKETMVEQQFSEVRSNTWLNANAKLCKCGHWVQKTDGCDHMTCKCGLQWCWNCGAGYGEINRVGNTAHKRTCPHYA